MDKPEEGCNGTSNLDGLSTMSLFGVVKNHLMKLIVSVPPACVSLCIFRDEHITLRKKPQLLIVTIE